MAVTTNPLPALYAHWVQTKTTEYMCPKCELWLDKAHMTTELTNKCLNCGQLYFLPNPYTTQATSQPA